MEEGSHLLYWCLGIQAAIILLIILVRVLLRVWRDWRAMDGMVVTFRRNPDSTTIFMPE
jgi:hypothetical protein